jgi:flagellar basal body-associated protein FliL
MQKQKGFIQIILPVLVLLIIAGFGAYYYFVIKPGKILPVNTSVATEYQADYKKAAADVSSVSNASDINTVSKDLDGTDINQIDTELESLSLDALSF